MKKLNYLILAFLLFFPAFIYHINDDSNNRHPANFASSNCRDLIHEVLQFNPQSLRKVIRKAFGMGPDSIAEGKIIQFGFESEYTLKELDGIVTLYAPDPRFGITHDQWLNMPVTERSDWVREHVSELFPKLRTPDGLVKIDQTEEWAFLPEKLILDDTNNIEFVLKPFDTFEDWYTSVSKINQRFGTGSMQGTVSAPTDSFFGRDIPGIDAQKVLDEKIGMFNFYTDYDILQKLNAGYIRYQNDPEVWTARNFDHPFLGPMNQQKQNVLQSMLRGNAIGEKYEPERLQKIAGWVNSFKYIGGTAYRPDILGKERVVEEVRDAHKNFNLLVDRMVRQLYFLQEGTQGLDKLKNLKSYDHIADFEKFPSDIQQELARLFPNKADPRFQYDPEIKKHVDVFRNFAYPLRDWTEQMTTLGAEANLPNVKAAQEAYLQRLSDLVIQLRASDIDDVTAKRKIQAALAQFVYDSKVSKAYEDYEDNVIFGGSRANVQQRFMREIAIEAGPIKQMFPEKIWTGPLSERMQSLVEKYPQNIKLVKDVPFKFKDAIAGHRNVYIVSLSSLSGQTKEEFIKDYLAAVSENTISFPLKEEAGHLYTRIGKDVTDFYFGSNVAVNAFSFPTGKKLETFFEFEPDEFLRFRQYIENGTTKGRDTLGSSGYNGVKGSSVGKIGDNRPGTIGADGQFIPSNENHNCTSWLCTAPIGDNGEAIHDLAGAPRSHEIHTNPGWWTMWLVNYGKKKRMPFAMYYANDSLETIEQNISSTGYLEWNFAVH